VETLINVLPILELGAETYSSVGTDDSTGTRLFCLSGHVERPGVYEHPHGVTLGDAIAAAGGVRGG
jgi:NADH-quinone oxidoreductase subunit F